MAEIVKNDNGEIVGYIDEDGSSHMGIDHGKLSVEDAKEVKESRWGTYDEDGEFVPDNEYLFSLQHLTGIALIKKQDSLKAGHYNKGDFAAYGAAKAKRAYNASPKKKISKTQKLQANLAAKKKTIRVTAYNKAMKEYAAEDAS